MSRSEHTMVVVTYFLSWISCDILLIVHVVLPLMRAGARFRERTLAKLEDDR